MLNRALVAAVAAAACLLGITPAAQARTARPLPPVHVSNLRAAYLRALPMAKPGKVTGTVYAAGHRPRAGAAVRAAGSTCSPEPNCPMAYGGGPVEHHPRLYLLLWGPTWRTSAAEQASAAYLESFYQGLGVRPQDNWSTITSQYTDSSGFPVFGGSEFAGVYNDTSTPPTGTTTGQFTGEADAFAAAHHLSSADDQVIIATQSGTCPRNFYAPNCSNGSGYYCAYHASSTTTGVTFTNLPYLPDSGSGCGAGIVPAGSNGPYEGFSIVGGHEYAETVTDPYGNAWIDLSDQTTGGEIGDKCAWYYADSPTTPDTGTVTLSTGTFAMQPLFSNANLAAGGQSCPLAASPDTLTVTSPGSQTATANTPVSLQVQASSSSGAQLAYSATGLPAGLSIGAASGRITGTPTIPGTGNVTVSAADTTGAAGSASFSWTVAPPPPGAYNQAGPVRILDTRNGTGGYSSPVGAGQSISLQVTGSNGVPASGVTAVVLNVTAVGPTASSFVTVYPDGESRPTASNLNFTAGETIPNLVTVPVGANGKIDFYNHSGSVNLLADLAGYYTTSGGSPFTSTGPTRILDTRNGTGGTSAPVGPGQSISLQVTGSNGVPAGATAAVLNVTAVGATRAGYVTVYPDGQSPPTASNLNFTAGETIPNLVIVPLSSGGKIDFYNHSGSVNLLADLAGYYTTGSGSKLVSIGPVRALDTRNGTGGTSAPVGPGQSISLQVTGSNGVPASGVTAVVLNVTAVGATRASYATVYPDGQSPPTASNLNFTAGQIIPNLVTVPVGSNGKIDFYNHSGSVDLLADLAGYYTTSG